MCNVCEKRYFASPCSTSYLMFFKMDAKGVTPIPAHHNISVSNLVNCGGKVATSWRGGGGKREPVLLH